jgi:hypothetical protein
LGVENRRFFDLSQNGKNGVPGWLDSAGAFFRINPVFAALEHVNERFGVISAVETAF